jgi:hypothetical protein
MTDKPNTSFHHASRIFSPIEAHSRQNTSFSQPTVTNPRMLSLDRNKMAIQTAARTHKQKTPKQAKKHAPHAKSHQNGLNSALIPTKTTAKRSQTCHFDALLQPKGTFLYINLALINLRTLFFFPHTLNTGRCAPGCVEMPPLK